MENIIYFGLVTALFIWLFIRDCELDKKRAMEQHRLGSIKILCEFRRYFKEENITPENDFDSEIRKLETQDYSVKWCDYLPFRKY